MYCCGAHRSNTWDNVFPAVDSWLSALRLIRPNFCPLFPIGLSGSLRAVNPNFSKNWKYVIEKITYEDAFSALEIELNFIEQKSNVTSQFLLCCDFNGIRYYFSGFCPKWLLWLKSSVSEVGSPNCSNTAKFYGFCNGMANWFKNVDAPLSFLLVYIICFCCFLYLYFILFHNFCILVYF